MVEFLNTLSEQDKRVIEDFYNFHKNYPDMRISVSRIGQVIVDEVDQDGKIEKTIELSLFQDDFEIEDAPLCVAVNFLKDKGGLLAQFMVIPQGNDEAVIDYYTGNEDQFEAVVEASKIGLSLLDKYRKIPLNLRYSVVLFNEIVSDERQMGLTKGKEYSGNEVQNTMLGILNRRIVVFRKQG